MNLINKEATNYEFLIETLDDLWVLSQFIVPGDRIFGRAERKVKIGSETNYKVVKKLIFVELKTTNIKFENETLRITGEIQNETEFTAIGASHTLTYSPGDKINLQKLSLLKFEEKMLNNALKSKKALNLLVLLDKDELIAAEFSEFSYRVLFEESGLGSKKYSSEEINEQEQKYKLIEDLLKKDYSKIILSGPGIFKDKLQKYIKDKIGLETISFHWIDVNPQSIQKVIKKINESSVLGESQLSYENSYVTKLLENINLGSKFAYGMENIEDCANSGRIEVLLISTKMINKAKDEGNYVELNNFMKLVEQLNGELTIIESKNEPGKILDGLGGIASILRY